MGQKNSRLYKAVQKDNIEKATTLLDKGADANAVGGEFKQSVLTVACQNGYKELAVLLVTRGATVNVGRDVITIPLHAAARYGHKEIVDYLVERDADVHKRGFFGRTAVYHAAKYKHWSVVKRLVSCGAKVDVEDEKGRTPLWYAAAAGSVNSVDLLLSVGANPHYRNKNRESPLDIAKKLGRNTIIEKLEDAVISTCSSSTSGSSTRSVYVRSERHASQAGQQCTTSQCVVQPSSAPSISATKSVRSEQHGHDQSREALPFAHSQSFGPAADVPITPKRFTSMKLMNDFLCFAVGRATIKGATLLLNMGADPNGMDKFRIYNVLTIACQMGYKELAVLLVSRGATVNVGDDVYTIPLLAAARYGQVEIVDFLVEKDADIHRQDYLGMTAVHHAAQCGYPSVVKRLVRWGANVDVEDKKGKTPLRHAADAGYTNCLHVLVSLGAKFRCERKNESPLDKAKTTSNNTTFKNLEDGVISSKASPRRTNHYVDCQFLASSAPTTRSLERWMQQTRSREVGIPAHSQSFDFPIRPVIHLSSSDGTCSRFQAKAASNTAKDEDLVKQLTDQQERLRQETETCKGQIVEIEHEKTKELKAAGGERRALETEMEEFEELLSAEKEQDEHRVEEPEELLSLCEEANTPAREMLRESEKVLSISSRTIQLTDKKLGSGSYGEVYIAYWNGCPAAVKMLYEKLAAYQRYIDILQQEVSISSKIHHPNIAAVCGVTIELEDEKKTARIVMELLQGSMAAVIDETRRQEVRPLTLLEKIDMTYDSLCGLKYLHTLPRLVLHGNIRPTNILVTIVMRAKLGDLGADRFSDASNTAGMMCPDYTAPERMDGRTTRKSKETDIYSMGVSVCELFTGLTPNPPERLDQVQLIQQRNVRLLCNRMVADEPDRRPSAGDGLTAIGPIRETDDYNGCPPRRMVKGKLDGVQHVTLTDLMW